jgi:hypothetical protein
MLNVQAQNYETKYFDLSFSIGPGHINTAIGISIHNELIFSFHRFFSTGLDFSYSNAYEGLKNKELVYNESQTIEDIQKLWHQTLYSFGLNGYFNPVKTPKHLIALGGGLSYNYQIDTKATVNASNSASIISLSNVSNNGIGFNLAVTYLYSINDKIQLGIKAYGVYFDDSSESILLSFGYKISK